MAILVHSMTTARKRGNLIWGKPFVVAPRFLPTEFDMEVERLGLTAETCASSNELRRWCELNRNRIYIPEWLLKEWGIVVDADSGWSGSGFGGRTAYPGRVPKARSA